MPMYKGKIPFHPVTGEPQFYPQPTYRWEYQGIVYDDYYDIAKALGREPVRQYLKRIDVPPDWRDNAEFDAEMKLVGYSRGRGAANFDVIDQNGTPYTVFMVDFIEAIDELGIAPGGKMPKACWAFCKRGEYFGIRLAK